LRELLERAGLAGAARIVSAGGTGQRYRDLIAGVHDGTLLRTPFELLAADRDCHVLATADGLGPYLGTVCAARRSWARAHGPARRAPACGASPGAAAPPSPGPPARIPAPLPGRCWPRPCATCPRRSPAARTTRCLASAPDPISTQPRASIWTRGQARAAASS